MNVEDITFGIEIETTVPAGTLRIGYHGHGCSIPGLDGWKADRDPSIRATRGHEACEFVSPVFKGSEGLKQCLADVANDSRDGQRRSTGRAAFTSTSGSTKSTRSWSQS